MKHKDFLKILATTDNPMEIYGITDIHGLIYFADDISREFRTSRYYKGWVFWHRAKHEMSIDSTYGYNSYNHKKLTVEIHHVITLYDVIMLVGSKMLSNLKDGEYYTTYQIVDELARVHARDILPLIPLLKSYHELHHEGEYDIDTTKIHGNYKVFLEEYKEYLTDYHYDKYKYLFTQ